MGRVFVEEIQEISEDNYTLEIILICMICIVSFYLIYSKRKRD